MFPNGYTVVEFKNQDVKQILPDSSVIYHYSNDNITQITIQNKGLEIYRYSNKQVEFHYFDGRKEIKFEDGTEKYIYPNGEEFTFFTDKTIQSMNKENIKLIEYQSGALDVVFPDDRKIEFNADGEIIPDTEYDN